MNKSTQANYYLFVEETDKDGWFEPPAPFPDLIAQAEFLNQEDSLDDVEQGKLEALIELLSCPVALLLKTAEHMLIGIIAGAEVDDDEEEEKTDEEPTETEKLLDAAKQLLLNSKEKDMSLIRRPGFVTIDDLGKRKTSDGEVANLEQDLSDDEVIEEFKRKEQTTNSSNVD